ncbi:MAG TPA: hypothetical protein HA349_11520, partial [Methanotrichaceae archaeon]|nr:hypothetical protein [Methanotrichaceae archaeon]
MSEKIAEQVENRRADGYSLNNHSDMKISRSSNVNYEGDSERKTVEAAYLVPEVDNFVEASEIKKLVFRIKLWLESGYPVHLVGPTGCGKSSLA